MNYSTIFDRAAVRCQTPGGAREPRRRLYPAAPVAARSQMQRKTPPVGERALKTAAWIVSLLCLAPIVAVAFAAVSGTLDTWNSLMGTVLPGYAWTTVKLVVLVGLARLSSALQPPGWSPPARFPSAAPSRSCWRCRWPSRPMCWPMPTPTCSIIPAPCRRRCALSPAGARAITGSPKSARSAAPPRC
jgi:hypothetical protein